MITITFPDGNDVVFSVPLEDITYKIRMCWNKEGQFWSMHLWDNNENVILANTKVVPNFPLLMNKHCYDAPRGELLALINKGNLTRNSFNDGSAILAYCTQQEWYGE